MSSAKTDSTEDTELEEVLAVSYHDGEDEIISDESSPENDENKKNNKVEDNDSPADYQFSSSSSSSRDELKQNFHDSLTPGESPLQANNETIHTSGLLQKPVSDDETLSQDSFADETLSQDSFPNANSDEIFSDEEISISDGEFEDEDHYHHSKFSEEDYDYEDLAYLSESEDEITVEDALATIVEEDEVEESSEEEEEEDDKGGAIQSLYSYTNEDQDKATEYGTVYEDDLDAGERSARPARAISMEMDEEEEMHDSGYFITKRNSSIDDQDDGIDDDYLEKDDLSELLKTKDWEALVPFLKILHESEDEVIRAALTRMDTYGNTKSYPIHFVVWKAPAPFIKNFIGAIPYHWQAETLSKLDSYGNTPLHLACSRLEIDADNDTLDVSVVEMISECGPETHELLNKQGDSPLSLLLQSKSMKADPLKLQAAEVIAEKLVRAMLKDRVHLITRKNMFDFKTLLHTAAANGAHEQVLLALLAMAGPSTAQLADTAGRIPLHYVAGCMSGKSPQATFAEKLVEAYPEGVVHKTTSGDTPLHIFVSSIQHRIKEKEDREGPESAKITGLLAGSTEDESQCALLVKNSNALAPLHCCALFNTPSHILKILMASPFAARASTVTDTNSATALHLACASSRCRQMLETIKILGTPEAAVTRDNKSRTPMHVAAENPNMTKHFIKALALVNPKAAKVRNSKGRMPLHIALRKRAKDSIIKALLKTYPKAVRTTFSGRNSVFHEMCQYKNSATIMKAMLKMHPAGAKSKNKFGNLPLHVAIAYECSTDFLKELLDIYPRSCMAKNKNGDTPLHHAAANNSVEAINLLLSFGPKAVIIKNKKGETALDQAKTNKVNQDIIKILEVKTKAVIEARAEKRKSSSSKERPRSSSSLDDSSNSKERPRKSSSSLDDSSNSKERLRKSSSSFDDTSRRSSRSEDSTEKKSKKSSSKLKPEQSPGSKSPPSSRKSGSVSPRTKRRSLRKSLVDDATNTTKASPVESPKSEKKGLRRMIKAAIQSSTFKPKSPLGGSMHELSPSKEIMSNSDHGGSEKKDKNKMSNSDHGPDRKSRGGGLSRSKSDRGFRDSHKQQLHAEEEFAKQLKLSKSPESLHDRTIRRGGRKPSDPAGKDGASLSPKGKPSKRQSRSRSRSRKRQSLKESSNSSGPVNATSALPLPASETPKDSKTRSQSKKNEKGSSSSVSSDGSATRGDSIRSTDSNSNSSRKSGVSSLRSGLKRVSSIRKSKKKNSASLGLDETPMIRSKKFTHSKRGNLVQEIFSSETRPFQASLPMEEDDSDI